MPYLSAPVQLHFTAGNAKVEEWKVALAEALPKGDDSEIRTQFFTPTSFALTHRSAPGFMPTLKPR